MVNMLDKLHIGDDVGWKEDYETSGKIVGQRGFDLLIKKWDENTGDWKERAVVIERSRCWLE